MLDEKRRVKLGKHDKESLWVFLKGYGLRVESRGGWFGAYLENSGEDEEDEGMMQCKHWFSSWGILCVLGWVVDLLWLWR